MSRLTALSSVWLAILATPALAEPPAGFENRAEEVRQQIGAPGMAIAIVEDGAPVFVRGFGTTAQTGGQPVDAETIFPTGSTGKAFTTAALGLLVDRGLIGWDDKVIDHLPQFRMYDHWVTGEMTVRDLLVHRSGLGLGQGDLLFVPRSHLSREEVVHRLRYLAPKTSFRSEYAYDNVLYIAAGLLIEEVTGSSWETFVREQILQPLDMQESTVDGLLRFETANRAYPHARTQSPVRGLGPQTMLDEHDELARSAAPAGGLAISASDMASWIAMQLGHGTLPDGTTFLSKATHGEIWQPVTVQPIADLPAELALTQATFDTYALGWEVRDYRGEKIIWHAGGVLGFQSVVVLIPDRNVGFSIEINSEDSAILFGLMYELLDHYLGLPKHDWATAYHTFAVNRRKAALAVLEDRPTRNADTQASVPANSLVGQYRDAWYGDIRITHENSGLAIDFLSTPRMNGPLEHWQYNTYVTHFTDPTIEPAYVTFNVDAEGRIDRVTMRPVSPLADFSYDYQDLLFRPVAIDGKTRQGQK